MKKVYLLITAICLTALIGCIKENVELTQANVSMSISTRAELSSSSEQGDAIGDINVWAFACDANGNVSESGQTAVAWRRISAANTHTSVDVHLQFATCNDELNHYYKLVAVINEGEFGTVSDITSFDRNTTYSQLANATFVANDLMAKTPGNGPDSTPGQMPISHWTIITLNKNNNGSTHPDDKCVEVSMPVYRAVAKTQLFVAKTDASTNLVIKNVTIGSSAFPTQGALLSAAEGTTNTDNTAGDFKGDGATTPMWYIESVETSIDKTETIFPSVEEKSVTKVLSKDAHASAEVEKFDYVTSHFLYENKGGSTVWNTDSTNGGYYMDVTYDITPDTANDDKTERVWLPAVVRNHDYQVRALVDAGGKLSLTLQVEDWEDVVQPWDYTDVPTLAEGGILKWTQGTVGDRQDEYKKDDEGNVTTEVDYSYKTVAITNTTPAICTFHIDTPAGATWQAIFVDGDVNSFEFVDNDSNTSLGQTASGNVGEQATLKIRATKPATDYTRDQQVFLDIVVRTADGRIIKVNQLMVDGDTPIKYKLVQNR